MADPPASPPVRSHEGRVFEPDEDSWVLSKDVTLALEWVLEPLDPGLGRHYRALLAQHASHYSAHYTHNVHFCAGRLLRATGADRFDGDAVRRFRGGLSPGREHELGCLRGFLARWFEQGLPGVDAEADAYLASVRLRGNTKGAAVRSMDARRGPLDDQELQAFNEAAAQAFERGAIGRRALAFALLLSHTGRRPGQLTMLRLGDLAPGPRDAADAVGEVSVPRSKVAGMPPRAEFTPFPVTTELGRALMAQARAVADEARRLLGPLPDGLADGLPLFPDHAALRALSSPEGLRAALDGDLLHARRTAMADALRAIDAPSERTGGRLLANPRRFRYTIGTRAARRGYGEAVVAELLDHRDTQNARVYTRDHPNFRWRVDEAVGRGLAELADSYAPTPVDAEAAAVNGGDPSMRVGTREHKTGTCGSDGLCGAGAEACYTCAHFQPWLDAPHERMLAHFLERRAAAVLAGASEPVVIASDRGILAARQVIRACGARRAELSGERRG